MLKENMVTTNTSVHCRNDNGTIPCCSGCNFCIRYSLHFVEVWKIESALARCSHPPHYIKFDHFGTFLLNQTINTLAIHLSARKGFKQIKCLAVNKHLIPAGSCVLLDLLSGFSLNF